jgi:hypothetical protein
MSVRSAFFLFLTVTLLFLLGLALPFHAVGGAYAAPQAQFLTATPGPDGRIMYIGGRR